MYVMQTKFKLIQNLVYNHVNLCIKTENDPVHIYEPPHKKTNTMHRRKQRCRSALQYS